MKRILFVHDQQEDPKIRAAYLENRGYEVELAKTADAAMKALARAMPSVVLLDILLDGENGFQLCRRIREKYRAEDLPVVMCSSIFRSRVYKDAARDVGVQLYLVRPFALDQMVDQIEGLMIEHVKGKLDEVLRGS